MLVGNSFRLFYEFTLVAAGGRDMNKTFKINARLVLTLGKGSIKDHITALVELVKNSYDADATKVWIDIFAMDLNNI